MKVYRPVTEKPKEEPVFQEIKPKPLVEEKPIMTCETFELIPGEISCQEAKELVLKEYPGEVYFIERTKTQILIAENQTEEREVWLMKISNFSKPISLPGIERVDEMEVAVDRNNGELNIISYEMSIK